MITYTADGHGEKGPHKLHRWSEEKGRMSDHTYHADAHTMSQVRDNSIQFIRS